MYPYHNLHNLQNIAKYKDQRLEFVEIPKGLIEILQNAGFTVEKILDSESSDIADKLGIDSYIGEIIHKETKKAVGSKINPADLLINYKYLLIKKTNITLIKTWDNDEAAKDAKTYQTQEGSLNALDHIIKKYMRTRNDKKINPSKQTVDEVLDLFTNTLLFDKKFHQFALYNYGVSIEYHKKENVLDIVKL